LISSKLYPRIKLDSPFSPLYRNDSFFQSCFEFPSRLPAFLTSSSVLIASFPDALLEAVEMHISFPEMAQPINNRREKMSRYFSETSMKNSSPEFFTEPQNVLEKNSLKTL
jgi:hypothetical protein